ncbi:MAG: hypothetical protein ACFE0Q_05900 [Anaerolineae bacterium]
MADESQQAQRTRSNTRKSPRQLSSTQVVFAVILAIALMLAVQFSARINDERNLTRIRASVEEEIALLRDEQGTLIDELAFVQSDAYVEQWARGEGRMVRDNMVLVIPLASSDIAPAEPQSQPDESAPSTVNLETTLPEPASWELWWALFFDIPPPRFDNS